jgi:membrane-associated phospholipid phosphatase
MVELGPIGRPRTIPRDALVQIAVAVGAVEGYEAIRRLLAPSWPAAVAHGRAIEALERHAHVDWERPLQHAFLRAPNLVQGADDFYLAGHFLLTGAFLCWLYRRSRSGFGRYRDALLAATALALLVHWRFPTAPPRLAGIGVVDTLRRFSGIDIGSTHASSYYDPVAAVPSLHAAYALAVGVGLVRHGRRVRARLAGAAYPPLVVLTTIVTGNHFLLDALAGFAVLGAGVAVAAIARRIATFGASALVYWPPRRGVEQSGSSPGS